MELVYDWKGFQALFHAKKKSPPADPAPLAPPVVVILEGKTILYAYCDNEDLSGWMGSPYEEMAKNLTHREKVVFDRKKVEEWMGEAIFNGATAGVPSPSHFPEEMQFLRNQAKPIMSQLENYKHRSFGMQGSFLLEATQGWWSKVIPSTYGLYIRLDDGKGPTLMMIIQRKKLVSFYIPDLGTIPKDKRNHFPSIIKYLSEKHLIPVQGISITSDEWAEWSETPNPWPKVFSTLRSHKEKVSPNKIGILGLLAARAYLKL